MSGLLFDVDHVEALLRASARAGEAMSYSEILALLDMAFTRPKMRALCKVLDEIDRRAAANDQPELAVLIVRESDRLPGKAGGSGEPTIRAAGLAARRGAMCIRCKTEPLNFGNGHRLRIETGGQAFHSANR